MVPIQKRRSELGRASELGGPREGQARRVGPGFDCTLDGGEGPIAGRHDAKHMCAIVSILSQLHGQARRGDLDLVKIIME